MNDAFTAISRRQVAQSNGNPECQQALAYRAITEPGTSFQPSALWTVPCRRAQRSSEPPIDRLPEQPVEPVDGVPAVTAVAQRRRIRQSGRVVGFAHHRETAIRTGLRAPELQSHPAVKIHPVTPPGTRTLRMIHEARPVVATLIDNENAAIRTTKSSVYPGNVGKDHSGLNTRNG